MADQPVDIEEQKAKLNAMMAEFRVAQQRRLEKHGIADRNRAMKAPAGGAKVPPAKLN